MVLIFDREVSVVPLRCEKIWIRKMRDVLVATKYQISAK